MITLRALGTLELRVDGAEAPRELLWRKNLALLLYLARSPERRRSRDHLVGVLWADKPDASARHSLNEALRVIRKSIGSELLQSVGDQVALAPGALGLDVDELDAMMRAGHWEEAMGMMSGPFAEGFAVPESSAFEDWLGAERHLWLERMKDGLIQCAEVRLAGGDTRGAKEAAAHALRLDPYTDVAVRLAMQTAAIEGERAAAIATYDAYVDRLSNDLGIEPDPETEALAVRVRSEREWKSREVTKESEWSRRLPLVGRETELRSALDAVSAAWAERSVAVLTVQGDAGSGKTRLGEEVAARLRLQGAGVNHIRCVPGDREVPWAAFAALARLAEHANPEEPGQPGPALADLIRTAGSDQPLLVWIDGAHHMDRESASSLQSLIRDCSDLPWALLLTGATYPPREELDELRTRIGRDVRGIALTLGAFDETAVRDLARAVLPALDEADLQRVARRIRVDSAGLPLLAVELLTAVALGLELDDVGGVWPRPFHTLEQSYPGDLPDSVIAAIRVGYRRLSRSAQTVLAAASVSPGRCDTVQLGAATGLSDDELFEALDELEWQRWLVADKRGYEFVARIVREVIERDMLTAGQRNRFMEVMSGG